MSVLDGHSSLYPLNALKNSEIKGHCDVFEQPLVIIIAKLMSIKDDEHVEVGLDKEEKEFVRCLLLGVWIIRNFSLLMNLRIVLNIMGLTCEFMFMMQQMYSHRSQSYGSVPVAYTNDG